LDLRLSVLGFEWAAYWFGWILEVNKQTLKALAIYRGYDIVFANNLEAILPLAFCTLNPTERHTETPIL